MHGNRRMGDRGGLPRRRDLARADHRRAQRQPQADHLPALPNIVSEALAQLQAAGQPASSSKSPKACSSATTADARRAEAPARARRRHRARRFRHRLFVDRLSQQGGLPQIEDRRQLRARSRHATGKCRDHPVDRPARQELPDDGHRRRRRDRRGFRADARPRLRHRSRAICSAGRCPTSAPTRWSSASAKRMAS